MFAAVQQYLQSVIEDLAARLRNEAQVHALTRGECDCSICILFRQGE